MKSLKLYIIAIFSVALSVTVSAQHNHSSRDGNSEIKELTLLNIKGVFPDNHMLHDAIDAQFKSDASLNEYDQFHKNYKINHFLESQGIK